MPALPVFVIRPATRPHKYAACSSSKTMGARFGPVREPEVVTKIVFGYSFAIALRPSKAPAFQPASEMGPGVRSATLKRAGWGGASPPPQETRARAATVRRTRG